MTRLYGYKYTRDQLEDAVKKSVSISGVMRNLGIKRTQGGNHSHIRERIRKEGIDTSHFTGVADYRVFSNKKLTPDEILSLDRHGGRRESIKNLRWALDQIGRNRECAICRTGEEWNGEKLVLEVNHIDGNPFDNRETNLEYLCPNCHQQVTFRVKVSNAPKLYDRSKHIFIPSEIIKVSKQAKNQRRTVRNIIRKECPICREEFDGTPQQKTCSAECGSKSRRKFDIDKHDLEKMIWDMPTVKVAEIFGVSDKAIEKRCRDLGISKPPRGYWIKKKFGKL